MKLYAAQSTILLLSALVLATPSPSNAKDKASSPDGHTAATLMPDIFIAGNSLRLATSELKKTTPEIEIQAALIKPPSGDHINQVLQSAPLHECDRLAAHPADADRIGSAVSYDTLIKHKVEAIKVCLEAVTTYPDISRFEFQLGRALDANKEHAQAVKWYMKAADRAYTAAMYNLAVSYDDGEGVTKDQAKANHWYRKAADQGRSSAMWNLAINLDEGKGGAHDPAGAAKYLLMALKAGHQKAEKAFDNSLESWQRTSRLEVQRALLAAGYYAGPIDGDLAGSTASALKSFVRGTPPPHEPQELPRTAQNDPVGQDVPLHACDRLAAHPSDADRIGNSVSFETLKSQTSEALEACRQAVSDNPGLSRFEFQLGRVLDALQQFEEAVEWYQKAADSNYTAAMFNLAVSYDDGEGVTKDQATANRWYRKAADQGRSSAMWNLAINLDEGKGGPHDAKGAADYLLKAFKAGHDKAKKAFDKNLSAWQPSTRREVLRVLNQAGYYQGPIEGRFSETAQKAAIEFAGGDYTSPAQTNETPTETRRVAQTGLHLCDRLAAHPSDADRTGDAVSIDILKTQVSEAISACRRAVSENPGVSRFEFQLGRALDAEKSHEEAVQWYRKAAERNYTAAMYNLAVSYDDGEGVTKDQGLANFWYRRAADQGRSSAMWNLSINLDEGKGGPHDPAGAAKYLIKAYLVGHSKAQKAFSKKLTAWQVGTRREVQNILQKAGYYDGPINGEIDGTAQSAMERYAAAETGTEPEVATDTQTGTNRETGTNAQTGTDALTGTREQPANTAVDQNVGVQECDRLAAHPSDSDRISTAVSFSTLQSQTPQAIAACRDATSQHPGVSRFEFQLGRALDAQKSHVEAVEWYTKAANRSYTAAMYNLAVSYDDGEGIDKNQSKANQWYRRAADQGRSSAMWNLSINLDEGMGGPRDPAGSAKYLLMAYRAGHKKAATAFDKGLKAWQLATRREVQRALKNAGYYNGTIDGQIGAGTRRSARDYRDDG